MTKEIKDIIAAFDQAQREGKQTALATVVQVQGSSYRRPGARMLIREDGQLTGAISGGCLEGDALRKALLAMTQQKNKLVTYDTTDEDDAKLGVQLGCSGIIRILIEPVNPAHPNHPVQLLKAMAAQGRKAVLVTLFSPEGSTKEPFGTCLLNLQEETIARLPEDHLLRDVLVKDAWAALVRESSFTKKYVWEKESVTAFMEFIQPAVSLVIIGAGNDAIPLAEMAHILGWQVTIADGRPNYATMQRFPHAHRIVVTKPGDALSQIKTDGQTVFVLMTHNYNYDLAVLRQLTAHQTNYIGLLGPRKKLERMLDEIREEGIDTNALQIKLYGPVGLDIGAETAEEIALSIASEIKAVVSGRPGKPLRDKPGGIHAHATEEAGEVNLFSPVNQEVKTLQ